jgi:cell division protein FtsB
MKNNEWNVPSDYFEKNKKALMPVRKMTNRNWLLALAAACVIGVGFFVWKGEDQVQEVAKVENQNEKQKENENENEGKRGEEEVREDKKGEDIGSKHLSTKDEVAEGLKEIPREELVAYLLEQDSELIENLN